MNLGKRLRAYRDLLNYTQEDLAIKAGIDEKYYGRIERGESCPTIIVLEKICAALNIDIVEFFLSDKRRTKNFTLDQKIAKIIVNGLKSEMDIHFNRDALLEGCEQSIWYNGYIGSISLDEYELCLYAVGNIKGKLFLNHVEVLEVNTNDIASELKKYVSDDEELNVLIEFMEYDVDILNKKGGNVFFVSESNWFEAKIINHQTEEILADDIILDSENIIEVFCNPVQIFDYI